MSTAARKARKRAGVQFVREQKVGTPVGERVEVVEARERRVGRVSRSFVRGFVQGLRGERGAE